MVEIEHSTVPAAADRSAEEGLPRAAVSGRPTDETAHRGPQFPCFDGLRAIAAVTVLMVHTSFASGFSPKNPHTWGPYLARLEIGVAVFFLISGFLLYRPFVDAALRGRNRPRAVPFYKRRLLRIIPAYWVALTFAGYVFHTVDMGPGISGFVLHFGFLQIYSSSQTLKGITQAWSLCTEITFYAMLPAYAWALTTRRRDPRAQLRVEVIGIAALFAVNVAFRLYAFEAAPGHFVAIMPNWLPAYLDLFAAGMALAVAQSWWNLRGREPDLLGRRWMPWTAWALAAVAYWAVSNLGLPIGPVVKQHLSQNLGRQALYGVFGFFLLLPAVFGPQEQSGVRRFLQWRPVAYVGVVSYGVYIWHEQFITAYRNLLTHHRLFSQPLIPLSAVTLAGAVAVATLSYRLVEVPFLRLKDRPLLARRARPSPRPADGLR